MTETAETLNQLWAGLLVEELVRNGVDTFCISPGSRSAPLALAAARNAGARSVTHYDERGAGFFALGYARACERPAALICTSGTAAANYYPAIIEASLSRIPMIVLTADRPPELLDTGANQTICQPGMFGSYTRWRFDLPCPSPAIPPSFVLTTVDQAVQRARIPERGPVHLNCPYREPLVSSDGGAGLDVWADSLWRASNEPRTSYAPVCRGVSKEAALLLGAAANEAHRPVIAIGQLDRADERGAAVSLARELECPILPGVASGLRLGFETEFAISHFDVLLSSPEIAPRFAPDLLIHLGGSMVSKWFQTWLERVRPRHHVRIADHPGRDDPGHTVTLRIEADISRACEVLSTAGLKVKDSLWLEYMCECERRVAASLDAYFAGDRVLTEPAIARGITGLVRESDGLFLGNSMPVRDMQRYAQANGARPVVFANRGVSGIDGNIATVAGAAFGAKRPITAILGDLAALHDLNSLALLRETRTPVVLVVLNNDGGGIFHFLTVTAHQEAFGPYFATPHGLTFESVAGMFGVAYAKPDSLAAFRDEYMAALERSQSTLIEIRTSRAENAVLHETIDAQALDALRA